MEVNIMFSFDEVQAYDPELAEAMKKSLVDKKTILN